MVSTSDFELRLLLILRSEPSGNPGSTPGFANFLPSSLRGDKKRGMFVIVPAGTLTRIAFPVQETNLIEFTGTPIFYLSDKKVVITLPSHVVPHHSTTKACRSLTSVS